MREQRAGFLAQVMEKMLLKRPIGQLFDARMYFHLEWLQLRGARLHLAMRMISRITRSFAIVHSDKRIKYKVGSQSPRESVFLCAVEKGRSMSTLKSLIASKQILSHPKPSST